MAQNNPTCVLYPAGSSPAASLDVHDNICIGNTSFKNAFVSLWAGNTSTVYGNIDIHDNIVYDFAYLYEIDSPNTTNTMTINKINVHDNILEGTILYTNTQSISVTNSEAKLPDAIDNRTGLTADDASANSIVDVIGSGHLYKIIGSINCSAYTSGTAIYNIVWTENGGGNTLSVSIAATGMKTTGSFLINPDSGTSITVQLTGTFSATVSVMAVAEQVI